MKTTLRHQKILELIADQNIDTQEQLKAELIKHGFEVTQATVSRDIKKLQLYKAVNGNGHYCYVAPNDNRESTPAVGSDFFKSSVLKIDYAMNNVVIRFMPGMAQAACAKIDHMKLDGVLGTVAGDDTVLIITRSEADSKDFVNRFETIFYQ